MSGKFKVVNENGYSYGKEYLLIQNKKILIFKGEYLDKKRNG